MITRLKLPIDVITLNFPSTKSLSHTTKALRLAFIQSPQYCSNTKDPCQKTERP